MTIAIGADHGGFVLKGEIVKYLEELGYTTVDVGCHSEGSVDYPDFAEAVSQKIISGEAERGILVCGTGIGMSIAANRHLGIRAAVCHDEYTARMAKEHNNANILCLGARVLGKLVAVEIVKAWVETEFAEGRHQRRIDKFS